MLVERIQDPPHQDISVGAEVRMERDELRIRARERRSRLVAHRAAGFAEATRWDRDILFLLERHNVRYMIIK